MRLGGSVKHRTSTVLVALLLGIGAGITVGSRSFPRTKTTISTYSTPVKTVTSASQTARLKHLEAQLATTKTYLATDQARAVELQNAAEVKRRVVSTKPSGLYGGQTKAENEEAGCRYGFTVSGETTHCNTQEEGRRIQEADQRERADPAREAENEAITEEDRNREACDERLGVAACE
jgi:hypothetical protein